MRAAPTPSITFVASDSAFAFVEVVVVLVRPSRSPNWKQVLKSATRSLSCSPFKETFMAPIAAFTASVTLEFLAFHI